MQREMAIRPEDTSVTLWPRLAEMGADLLVETLRGLEQKQITPVPQDHTQATLAPILKKEDGQVDFSRTATEIHNRLRGFQPWPGAYAQFRGKNLKFVSSRPEDASSNLAPGELRVGDDKLFAGCAAGTVLQLLQVQPEGKKIMTAREFINGYHPAAGERLV
jgi:methionyl-tRNA formyltransferase